MRGYGKHLVQHRRDLMPTSLLHRGVDSIATALSDSTKNFALGSHEYRVHAMGGKVVPGATSGRGSNLTAYTPHGGEYVEKAEALVNKLLKKLPIHRRKHFYGMDVGIDTKGNPFIIEMNPSDPTGTSGFVGSPFMVDALSSAIRGRTSRFSRIKDIGAAGGVVGAGGLGAHLYNNSDSQGVPDYSNLA